MTTHRQVQPQQNGPLAPVTIARLYAGYEELRSERHLVDFESVLELTAAILAEHRSAAMAVRDRYRYFVVDEYQDVNPLQKLLLDVWAADTDDVCVVGDPRQTIYSFTGATPAYLTGFAAAVPARHRHPAGAQLPSDAAGGRAGQPAQRGCGRAGTGAGSAAARGRTVPAARPWSRSAGRRSRPSSTPDEPAEAAAVARQAAEPDHGRDRGGPRSPCWSGPTPRSRAMSRRWRG